MLYVDYIYGGEPDVATDGCRGIAATGQVRMELPCLAQAVGADLTSLFGQSASAAVVAGNCDLGNATT